MPLINTQILARQIGEALQRGDRATFVSLARQLIGARPRMNSGYKSLSEPLLEFGERSLARQAIDLYVEANGGSEASRSTNR